MNARTLRNPCQRSGGDAGSVRSMTVVVAGWCRGIGAEIFLEPGPTGEFAMRGANAGIDDVDVHAAAVGGVPKEFVQVGGSAKTLIDPVEPPVDRIRLGRCGDNRAC